MRRESNLYFTNAQICKRYWIWSKTTFVSLCLSIEIDPESNRQRQVNFLSSYDLS